ncbi:MAG TPA: hypothetical protein VKU61_00485 [Candidatus Binatia bacterium]|nr:hypothetical protein [Candidatus Binatia bacterium]
MRPRGIGCLVSTVALAALLVPSPGAAANPLQCQRAIERGSTRYLDALFAAADRCTATGLPYDILDCLANLSTDAELAGERARWSRRAARECAHSTVGADLPYYATCDSDVLPGRCAFPSPVLDAPGADNDVLDCLACQMRAWVSDVTIALFGGHPLPDASAGAEATCARAIATGGVTALRTLTGELGRCLGHRRGTSIAVCIDDPGLRARVDSVTATWRAQAVTACTGVDPFTVDQTLNYPHECNGPSGAPGQVCRVFVPPCTFASTNRLDGPGDGDDLLDCLGCRVEETALGIGRAVQGASLCCTDAGCGVVMSRKACLLAHGRPAYYRIDDSGVSGLFLPHGLAFAPDGTLYVADFGSDPYDNGGDGSGRVVTISPDLTTSPLASLPEVPLGIALDSDRNAYVPCGCAELIRRVTPTGEVSLFAGTGTAGHSGDGGPATEAAIALPRRAAVDAAGNVYFTESGLLTLGCTQNGIATNAEHVRYVDPAGIMHTIFGAGPYGAAGEDGPAASAEFGALLSLIIAPDQTMVLGEVGTQRVLRIHPLSPDGIVSRLAGRPGNPFGTYSGDGGPARRARFFSVEGVAQDPDGNVVVSDFQNNRVRLIDTAGSVITIAGSGEIAGNRGPTAGDGGPGQQALVGCPQELAQGPDGRLWFHNQVATPYLRTLTRVLF